MKYLLIKIYVLGYKFIVQRTLKNVIKQTVCFLIIRFSSSRQLLWLPNAERLSYAERPHALCLSMFVRRQEYVYPYCHSIQYGPEIMRPVRFSRLSLPSQPNELRPPRTKPR